MSYVEFLQGFFSAIWSYFCQLRLPIIGLTFGEIYLGLLVAILGLFIIRSYFGFGSHTVEDGKKLYSVGQKKYQARHKNDNNPMSTSYKGPRL